MSRSMKSNDYLLSMAWAGELTSRLGRGDPLQEPLKHDFRHAVCVHQKAAKPAQTGSGKARICTPRPRRFHNALASRSLQRRFLCRYIRIA
jgi:hypothetical protein